ncbi:transient receptor potential cation channel subfamily A member 1 homolog isoform X1 [Homarus americanus]|uniref:transient receptor potential cation channel subfamily A member 1 homolog isoform X1 n=1 Tax=Homarus americanus TaxID=6706 RepID=UPI001C438DFA|nr:transient receptor potential cation channel subfamily A member 1 homolog isoform X1 [Homarus americanus]
MTFEFTEFENNYYIPKANAKNSEDYDEESPFKNTGELKLGAKQIDDFSTYYNHPVRIMIEKQEANLLLNPVTQAWLDYKWSYLINFYRFLIGSDFIHLMFLIAYMGTVWNTTDIDSCDIDWATKQILAPHVFYCLLWLSWILIFCEEVFLFITLNRRYITFTPNVLLIFRLVQFVLTLILLISPLVMQSCQQRLGVVQEVWSWQCGVVAVLLTWVHVLDAIHQIYTSETLPVLKDFGNIIFKVLYFVFTFVLIFSFIFHILLRGQKNFSTWYQSIGSSLAWMLLDLDYGDIFVDPDSHLQYPIQSNLIFFLFVTCIVFLIMSLIDKEQQTVTERNPHSVDIKRIALRVELIFKLDKCAFWCHRSYVKTILKKSDQAPFLLDAFFGSTPPTKTKEETPIQSILDKVEEIVKNNENMLKDVENTHDILRRHDKYLEHLKNIEKLDILKDCVKKLDILDNKLDILKGYDNKLDMLDNKLGILKDYDNKLDMLDNKLDILKGYDNKLDMLDNKLDILKDYDIKMSTIKDDIINEIKNQTE